MSIPQSYKAFRRSLGPFPKTLELVTEQIPSLNAHEVLIRIHAVTLNYRDVAKLDGTYPVGVIERGVPSSDCAAEVVAIGPEVDNFKIGDRVTPIFDLNNLNGTEETTNALGGDTDGVLRQFAVFHQNVLLHFPEHLSWEEVFFAFW
jgi:NADPH:quinone reductase-like Zn-dependent oxidoreductase